MWRLSEAAPLNIATVSRIQGPLTLPTLEAAIDAVCRRHPYLRVRIVDGETGPGYEEEGVGRPAVRVLDGDEDQWISVTEEEINRPIAWDTGPLIRFVLLRHAPQLHHVIAAFHHVIGDGMSGAYLMRDLFLAAARICEGAGSEACLEPLAHPTPLDLGLPRVYRGGRGFFKRVRFIARTITEDLRLKKPARPHSDGDVPSSQRFARVNGFLFDEAETATIAQQARREGVTVHAALSAAVCLTMAQEIGDGQRVSIKHRSPVNLRNHLAPPVGEDMGMFASMLFFRGRISGNDDFWETARAIRRQLKTAVDRGIPLTTATMLPVLYGLLGGDKLDADELGVRWRERTPSTTALTNMGRLPLDTRSGPFQIEAIRYAVAPSVVGDFTCTAASLGGQLNWNFIFPEPTFRAERAAALAEETVSRLRRALA